MNLKKSKFRLKEPLRLADSVVSISEESGLSDDVILQAVSKYLSTDASKAFMDHLSKNFDLPESLDTDLSDFASNMGLSSEEVVAELNEYWSTEEVKEFLLYLSKNYDI